MSRKVKFSNNWKKTKAKVQHIHSRIGNARRDYLHKATTTISCRRRDQHFKGGTRLVSL